MKYVYSFETRYLINGAPFLVMKLPAQLEMITSFLSSEVQTRGSSEGIRCALHDAIVGLAHHQEWSGNIYGLDIHPEMTTITNDIDPDGEGPCVVETRELSEILEIWLAEKERVEM